jgi:L-ribulose-5-phosphate 4-epimerase
MSDPALLAELRTEVLLANQSLPGYQLVTLTWGNVSAIDRDRGLVVIKPSGVSYAAMTTADLVVVDLEGGIVAGELHPSTDTPTHLALYRAFPDIGAVVHTHSTWATSWAQAGREIPLLGTTHADLCAHPIPVTRPLQDDEVALGYEAATALVIIEAVAEHGATEIPCVLVHGHAPFCWGANASAAVEHAVTLEQVARMALATILLAPEAAGLSTAVRDKHHDRKHGPRAYYGQD